MSQPLCTNFKVLKDFSLKLHKSRTLKFRIKRSLCQRQLLYFTQLCSNIVCSIYTVCLFESVTIHLALQTFNTEQFLLINMGDI